MADHRILLVTGKGGVGKTTTAAATALRLADRGVRTLLVSADPAHSVADVLGAPGGTGPDAGPPVLTGAPVAVVAGLDAVQLDGHRRFEEAWAAVLGLVAGVARRRGVDLPTAAEVGVLPGAEEVLALLAVLEHAEGGEYDALVVDLPPTAATLRLLALPEVLARHLRGLLPAGPRSAGGWRLLAAALGHASPPADVVATALGVHDRLLEVRALFDRAATVRLVLTPETVVLAETRRAHTALSLFGYAVDGLVVNRMAGDERDGGRARAQAAVLAEVAAAFPGLPVQHAPLLAAEPVGPPALRGLADHLWGELPGRDPLERGPVPGPSGVRAVGDGYELSVPLPLAQRGDVDAARVGDDLVVTVAGHRRSFPLAGVLRRCRVTGGRFVPAEGDTPAHLVVRFVPDPALWSDAVPRPEASGD